MGPRPSGGLGVRRSAQTKPEGEMKFALYVTIAPAWFDPGEAQPGFFTPFWMLVALHDALVRPMPGKQHGAGSRRILERKPGQAAPMNSSCARGSNSITATRSPSEDVVFSFNRAKGAQLHEKVKEVVAVDPYTVRFVLHEPWPDFMTFYGTFASAAGWIVPKNYFEKVGPDGFKNHPIGLGPYKFVSMKPGLELVMEANENYWRKVPSVKRIVFQSVPEATTRLAMLKRGEVDLAYLLEGQLGESIRDDRDAKARLFGRRRDQFHRLLRYVGPEIAVPRSARAQGGEPRDRPQVAERGRYARRLEAERQSRCRKTSNSRCRSSPTRTIRHRRKSCSPRPAIRTGSTPAICTRSRPISRPARRSSNYLGAVGIRAKLRTMERAAFYSALGSKKLKGLCFCSTAIMGNASTRIAAIVPSDGTYAYGGWPDLDELYKKQLSETDPEKRGAMLAEIQKILHERVRFAPIWDYFWPSGVGPRVADAALMKIDPFPWSAPLEDVQLKRP